MTMETKVERTAEHRRAHAEPPASVDVAIIGSGLGGLMAGANLARQGLKVAVFEQHYVAGGCATQFSRGPKRARYHFDVGLHYIGDCEREGTIPRLLRDVGVELGFEKLDPDGFDTLIFPGLEFRVPVDLDVYRDRLAKHFPRETRGIDRYVRLVRAVMKAMRATETSGRLPLRGALTLGLDALRLARIQSSTLAEVLDQCGARDRRLRAVLAGQSGDYGLPPSRVSAMLHLGLAGHYFRGAYYPRGGGQVIADRLAEVIESSGGSVHLRRGVARVIVESGVAKGVLLEARAGEPAREVRADVVLSNADLAMTLERLVGPEHLPASWITRARSYEMPAALFMTFLGVKADMRALGMRNCNYWQFDDDDVERQYRSAPGDDPLRSRGAYITSASLKDPSHAAHHAPDGVTNVEVMTLVPPSTSLWGVATDAAEAWRYRETDEYRAKKAALEEQMIARLDGLFPGAARAIVFRESATPVSHVRFTRATGGTGYGIAATPAQFLLRRPGYGSPIGGLYFCGASTRAGHGIVGAMLGGRQAARRIARDLGREGADRVRAQRSLWT